MATRIHRAIVEQRDLLQGIIDHAIITKASGVKE
jgi:hypothetical protein